MSREAKKRILQQAAEFLAQQEQGGSVGDAAEECPGSEECWTICAKLEAAARGKTDPQSVDAPSIRELLPCAPPPAKPASEEPSRFKWKTSLDEKFEFDFYKAIPRKRIDNLSWGSGVRGVQRSSAGSEGVFFVAFRDTDEAVVIKGSRNIAAEAFAGFLALKLGLKSPDFRIISVAAREAQAMMHTFREVDHLGLAHAVLSKQSFLLIKNFVRGVNLGQVKEADLIKVFGEPGAFTDGGRERFKELAALLLLDVLCNNGDRFPLIWDNRGNPGNVMFARSNGQVIAIDNNICAVDEATYADQHREYLSKVENLIHLTARHTDEGTEAPQFHRVRDKVIEYCNYDYGLDGSLLIQQEFLHLVQDVPDDWLTEDELAHWVAALSNFTPPLVGIHAVSAKFVMAVWNTLRESAQA
ncbi:hypothetical protein PTSG_04869 [Salpingoeca rosetta]|uniref:Actin-fragmin kinase catalytic domain-containing protein n=1 Tax=Salpingoeca rosetta (strain ATCC 50818 / BSB-021) TaxID=946362 RepID=F2U8V3_SALR5|nr:uncharacterized protein PTSG_04869 [Salpingoeca rosetta]EGD73156.1 hypothetical protein PTSG_04869 [Salpingoeca rosetta]|eukprot:XP_004994187.1 hypothetical protein PTSG_04869 [Salpingoeca rosetta]